MRRFTLFTLLYIAAGVFLMALALQGGITANVKTTLLLEAGPLYLLAVLSTFPFWYQSSQRSQARMSDKPAWQQNFVMVGPWLVIALTFVSAISNLLRHHWTTEAIASAFLGLPIILLCVESIFRRNQIHQ